MSVLIVGGVVPSVTAPTEAACVYSHAFINSLLNANVKGIHFALINNHMPKALPDSQADIERLEARGVKFHLDPAFCADPNREGGRLFGKLKRAAHRRMDTAKKRERVQKLLQDESIDAIIVIWAEYATALLSRLDVKSKIAVYGNLHHNLLKANQLIRLLSDEPTGGSAYSAWLINAFRNQNWRGNLMQYDIVCNVAKNDADTIGAMGMRSAYLPMIWQSAPNAAPNECAEGPQSHKGAASHDVMLSVGNKSATGNSLAFLAYISEIRSWISEEKLASLKFHIFGGGNFRNEYIRQSFAGYDEIVDQGFVDDLNGCFRSFLCCLVLHGFFDFRVAHTRILNAWEQQCPVIAHEGMCSAMPELRHGHNCLLFKDSESLNRTLEEVKDLTVRETVTAGGLSTMTASQNSAGYRELFDMLQGGPT